MNAPFVEAAAALVPDYVASAAVLIVAALLALAFGLRRRGREFFVYVPAALYVLLGAAAYWPLRGRGAGAVIWLAGASLVIFLVAQRWAGADDLAPEVPAPEPEPRARWRGARVYLAAALILSGIFLFKNLGSYAGTLLTWESPVISGESSTSPGFAGSVGSGESVLTYTAKRLLWDNGVLSAGNTSLFYGAPTYALFRVVGFSTWTLRIAAAVAALLSVAVTYVLARRFFGPVAGGAAALLFGLNAAVLFYGRYGSSAAGTILAVLLAVLATFVFLDDDHSAWWMAIVCAAALYLATLQYSPARLVVLMLLGFTAVVLLVQWRRLWWRRAVGAAILIAAAIAVWKIESAYSAQTLFLFARGEQFLFFSNQGPDYIKNLFGHDMVARPFGPTGLDFFGKLELLYNVLQVTVPGYVGLLDPHLSGGPASPILNAELPLRLYYGPAALFIVWGIVYSALHPRSWRYAFLVVWLVVGSVPILLTNRADAHRMILFVIPLSLFAAIGVREGARVLAAASVPLRARHLLAALLAATLVYHLVIRFRYAQPPAELPGFLLAGEMGRSPGPVIAGSLWDHREASWLRLQILERERRDPQWSGEILHDLVLHSLSDESSMPSDLNVRDLVRKLDRHTILIGPAERFQKFAAVMQTYGARVAERGSNQLRILRIDGGATASGVPDEAVKPMPTIVIPPTPTPLPLRGGPQIALTDLQPRDVQFGFAPPNTDRDYNGQEIRMGGRPFSHGIGVHAWTRMTFDVPPRAATFQAVAGLSDSVKQCGAAAAVTFEVRNERGERLYDSGRIDAETAPRVVQVDVRGAKAITLEVTEGGNGRDCDHANWGDPVFLVE